MISMQDEISPDGRPEGTEIHVNPNFVHDSVSYDTGGKNKVVPMESMTSSTVGAVKLQPPDIDEDAGYKGKTEYKALEVEKGKDADGAKDDTAEKKKKKSFFSKPSAADDSKKEKEEKKPTVGWFELFRFSSGVDTLLCIIGSIAALAHGAIMPLMILVFGNVIDGFVLPSQAGDVGPCSKNFNMTALMANLTAMGVQDPRITFIDKMTEQIIYFVIIASVSLFVGYVQAACWNVAAENQVRRIRMLFFRNLLRQDVGWYDQQESGAVTAKFAEDIMQIQKGIGEKVALFIQNLGAFIGGMVIGFYKGWKLSLVTLSISPLLAVAAILMIKFAFTQAQHESAAYAKAGAIAQEVLGAIRTVASFGGQKREIERYAANLDKARIVGTKKGVLTGVMMGLTFFIIFGAYALGFSYGVKLINDKESGYQIGQVTTTFFAIIMGTFSIGLSVSSLQAIATARSSAFAVFAIIDRIPPIDAYSKRGKKPDSSQFRGRIEYRNVSFRYPTRPDSQILRDISLTIEPGTTVALVGASGCGKSTIVQLLQRFYDPEFGTVLVDGEDLRDYNIFWFRSMIGSVSQEPVLFGTSIFENIRFGYPNVTKQEVETAAKLANAHDFIAKLPQGYDTLVGEQGAQLSGGQKQRIAIARAIVRNPRILLLDEATSALDTESEAIVQEALDRARTGRTTIAIAHRLSTIMNADKIIVIDSGAVYEVGTHGELIAKQGIYAKLVEAQQGREIADIESGFDQIKQRRTDLVNKSKDAAGTSQIKEQKEKPKVVSVKPELTAREKKKQDETLVKEHFSALRLWKMAKSEYPFFLLGLLGAIVCGGVWPCFGIIFSKMLGAFTSCSEEERTAKGLMYSLIFLAIGAACFIGFIVMMSMTAFAGERLVARIRKMAFGAMLRQEIAWFDDDDNAVGALTSRLATQAGAVKDATGASLAQMAQSVACLITALVIGFVHEWRITLIMIAFTPLVIFGGIVQGKAVGDFVKQDKFVEQAARALVQSTTNIRTVTSLGIYQIFIDMFNKPLIGRHKREILKIQVAAFCFGLSEAALIYAYAAAFYAGANFIRWGWTEFEPMFTALAAVMFSAFSMGQANAMAPDQKKAQLAVAEIFKLLDRAPTIDSDSTEGKKPDSFSGNTSFNEIEFHYPTRPTAQILRGLNLQVERGQTIALVGGSGGGKSTVIQLLERFYDPVKGDVKLDENVLASLNLSWARGKMSLVSQEPILFDRTIAENIIYGVDGLTADNLSTAVSQMQNEITAAAKASNIHDVIMSLPEGYNTRVGERGGQLSGGQKQRVAIARALIRQPELLLLDEATSALDSESEKVVQEALDKARTGRTVLVIAHRLSTIENADLIAVIADGVVRELGKHQDLLAIKGIYYGLWSAQQLTN